MAKKGQLYKLPDKTTFENVCRAKMGTKCEIAKALNITRRTLDLWLKKENEYAEIFLTVSSEFIELGEYKIKTIIFGDYSKHDDFKGMTVGERIQLERIKADMTKFYLTHQGRDRGWGDELGLNVNKGKGLVINFEGNEIKFNT